MRRFSLLVLVGVLILASPNATFAQKVQSPQPVVVTNTSPIPVSGNVNAAVTGNVNANITNTVPVSGTVSLAPGAAITVDPSTQVNTADTVARNIVRLVANFYLNDGIQNGGPGFAFASLNSTSPFVVPAGKRLVVTSVSGLVGLPTGQQPLLSLYSWETLGASPSPFFSYLNVQLQNGTNGFDSFVFNSTAPFYVDATYGVTLSLSRNASSGILSGTAWIQGYLVDCGSGCTQQ